MTSTDRVQALIDATPMRRAGKPEEVADAVHFFLTAPDFVTGQISGGRRRFEPAINTVAARQAISRIAQARRIRPYALMSSVRIQCVDKIFTR